VVVDGPVVTDSREAAWAASMSPASEPRSTGIDFIGNAQDAGAVAALTTRTITGLPGIVVPTSRPPSSRSRAT
jgi:UDP-N-acetylmuramoyl-tripeptide--D-alanyl-D-alanine ligase